LLIKDAAKAFLTCASPVFRETMILEIIKEGKIIIVPCNYTTDEA